MCYACKCLYINRGYCLSTISSPSPLLSSPPCSLCSFFRSLSLCLCPPLLSLSPRGTPFSKVQASEPFAPSLLHYFTLSFLSLALSLRGGLQWLFITQQVNLHHGVLCVLSLAQTHIVTHPHIQVYATRIPPYLNIKTDVYTLHVNDTILPFGFAA